MRVLTSIEGDGITSPDILGVDLCEADILYDDVLCSTDDTDTFALDDTLGSLSDQTLVGADCHTKDTGLVIRDGADLGCVGLVVLAPVVLVDGLLASGSSAPLKISVGILRLRVKLYVPWSTSVRGHLAFGAGKVEGLCKDDNSW